MHIRMKARIMVRASAADTKNNFLFIFLRFSQKIQLKLEAELKVGNFIYVKWNGS